MKKIVVESIALKGSGDYRLQILFAVSMFNLEDNLTK